MLAWGLAYLLIVFIVALVIGIVTFFFMRRV